jgi:hypothetical protein
MTVFQTVYLSEAVNPLDRSRLEALLAQARLKNHRLGLTGLLLYHEGKFMQLLEGDRGVVQQVMASIRQDPRHRRVVSLLEHQTHEREFAEWSMALRTFDDSTAPRPEGLRELFELFELPVDVPTAASRAQRLLTLFRNNAH